VEPLNRLSPRQRQRGAVTLFALIALLLMFLGALYTFRGVLLDTSLTDKAAARQKDVQASDLALQWLTKQIIATSQGSPLETTASGQTWFLSAQPGGAVTPTAAYWSACEQAPSATQTCAQVAMPSGVPQSAWVFAQPTGRTDAYACNTPGFVAIFYDLWVHTVDPRTGVAADTESLYKLCARSN